jgi:heme/copper-type cytochrome/quinol oxidase subunit 2
MRNIFLKEEEGKKKEEVVWTVAVTIIIAVLLTFLAVRVLRPAGELIAIENERISAEAERNPQGKEAQYQKARKCPEGITACSSLEKYREKHYKKKEGKE